MKNKIKFICLLFCMTLFVSCFDIFPDYADPNDYEYRGGNEEIYAKTTIKTFSHLKEPIVVSMPVCEKRYYAGKKKKFKGTSKYFRNGDRFIVIDIENDKNEIFDWVYFGEEKGMSDNKVIELGENPTRYYIYECYARNIACLDPTKTEVELIKGGVAGYGYPLFCGRSNKTGYSILCNERTSDGKDYTGIKVFDSRTNTLKEQIKAEHDSGCLLNGQQLCDEEGNFWFISDNNGRMVLYKVDSVENKVYEWDLNQESYQDYEHEDYTNMYLEYVSGNKIIINKAIYRNSKKTASTFIKYSINGEQITKVKEVEDNYWREEDNYSLRAIINVNKNLYAVFDTWITEGQDYVDIFRFNFDSLGLTKLDQKPDKPFRISLTAKQYYVRGSRIYFMNSSDSGNLGYTWYDVESNTYSDRYYIINEYYVNKKEMKYIMMNE